MLKITSAKGWLAKQLNIKKGDAILAFNGFEAVDSLDYLFYDSKEKFTIKLQKKNGEILEIEVDKDEEESLNLTFEQNEKIRTCHNKCVFCFVDQMPPNMRKSLYVKDDDYVLSFMCGNFVTLTNLSEEELERIIRLHLSPIYVSVHTMDENLRCELMGNRFAGKIVNQLKRLTEAKITVHCQAVIVPGKNDGKNLEYTARKLFEMHPYIADLAVVPTGITKYRENLAKIDDITNESAASVLEICDRLNKEFGKNFLLPADEYFIRSGKDLKPVEFYGDFSQIENGIGMTTKFIAEFKESVYPAKLNSPRNIALITGVSAQNIIQNLCDIANQNAINLHAFALPVKNSFFGETVTCTGLITGNDIINELNKNLNKFDTVIIPSNTLKEFEEVFLDGVTVKQLKKILKGKKVIINKSASQLYANLLKG